jgi:hypothetical protein
MKKWKNIRDSYKKEVNLETTTVSGQSAPKKKRYIYYELLSFLRPSVSTAEERESNVSPIPSTSSQNQDLSNSSNSSQNQDFEEDNLMRPPRQNRLPTKRKKQMESTQIPQITKILNESLQLQKLNNDSDAKGNRAFLMSFVPIMDSMTPDLAMETRYEITNLFRNIQRNERNRSIPSNLSEFLYHRNQEPSGSSGSRTPMTSVASPQYDTASDTSTENDDYFNVLQYLPQ